MFTKSLFHIISLVDPFDPSELIDAIRELYKTREGWLAPFPWCEEFHSQLNDIYTRLKMIDKTDTIGKAREIVNMWAMFETDEDYFQPITILIEGKPGMGKQLTARSLSTTGLQES